MLGPSLKPWKNFRPWLVGLRLLIHWGLISLAYLLLDSWTNLRLELVKSRWLAQCKLMTKYKS